VLELNEFDQQALSGQPVSVHEPASWRAERRCQGKAKGRSPVHITIAVATKNNWVDTQVKDPDKVSQTGSL
jgi:hypothetical protein